MNMKNLFFLFILFAFMQSNYAQTVTDYDGNVYTIITIGTQQWLGENLKVTHYRNGDPIPNITDDTQWSQLNTGAYCWYNNDITNKQIYGALYNWYTVNDSRNVAPIGWHVPSRNEWILLKDYLGGSYNAGGKLKEIGTAHWQFPNTGATNETNFTALPGGVRGSMFISIREIGYWWTSTNNDLNTAFYYKMLFDEASLNGSNMYLTKKNGISIRCIRDDNTGVNTDGHYELNIYPNPAKDKISIELLFPLKDIHVSILNINSQEVLRSEIKDQKTCIDIRNLPNGVYFVKLQAESFVTLKKLIKE